MLEELYQEVEYERRGIQPGVSISSIKKIS
jgi:hypothetical protein